MSAEDRRGVPGQPEGNLTVYSEQRELGEITGFSPEMPAHLMALNNVLGTIIPPTLNSAKISFVPNLDGPQIENAKRFRRGFTVELELNHRSNMASLKVEQLGENRDAWLRLNNLQEFAKQAFPGRRSILRARFPTIGDYDKQKDLIRELLVEKSIIPLEFDLGVLKSEPDMTEEVIHTLATPIDGLLVQATLLKRSPKGRLVRTRKILQDVVNIPQGQLYSHFDAFVEGYKKPVFEIQVVTEKGNRVRCFLRRINFVGTPEEIERTTIALTELFMQTPAYQENANRPSTSEM